MARIFEKSLRIKDDIEMGRNSEGVIGFCVFGIRIVRE